MKKVSVSAQRKPIDKEMYKSVLKRDNCRCVRCHRKRNLELHHLIPVVYGGVNAVCNLITLCEDCHSSAPNDPIQLLKYCRTHMSPELERSKGVTSFIVLVCLKELGFTNLDPVRNEEIFNGVKPIVDNLYDDIWEIMRATLDRDDDVETLQKLGKLVGKANIPMPNK